MLPRAIGDSLRQPSRAPWAASIARSTSATSDDWKCPRISLGHAGLRFSFVAPPKASRHSPPM